MTELLDSSRPLSDALCEVLMRTRDGCRSEERFDFSRTMVLVPGGRLSRGIERGLLARARSAKAPMAAPTIVTPLLFASRFLVPTTALLSPLAARVSWREALDAFMVRSQEHAQRVAELFGVSDVDTSSLRHRFAARLARVSSEIAAAMQTPARIAAALHGEKSDAAMVARWRTMIELHAERDALLSRASARDKDVALREAIERDAIVRNGFDVIVVLLADPDEAVRALLRQLAARGVDVRVCVHTREAIDAEGFPVLDSWESHAFAESHLAGATLGVTQSTEELGRSVVDALRALPAGTTSDELAVMASNDETSRAIERALLAASTPVARGEARTFAETRLGTLLERLHTLLAEGSAESLAAFVRHVDVTRHAQLTNAAAAITEYRSATLVESWRTAAAPHAAMHREYADVQHAVRTLVAELDTPRAPREWARPLRALAQAIVGEDLSGAFDNERERSVQLFDRALMDLHEVPAECSSKCSGADVLALLLDELRGKRVRGDAIEAGVTLLGWLDAGISDQAHVVLAGFSDGLVPEDAPSDALVSDDLRLRFRLPSRLRRVARDAWILDGIIARTKARAAAGGAASMSIVLAERASNGDPLRPSRFLLRVERKDLAARVQRLFPQSKEVLPRAGHSFGGGAVVFPKTPAIDGAVIARVSVTDFKNYITCPYLFLLKSDPRLRLQSTDERAAELSPAAFGTLLHGAVELWGRAQIAQSRREEDARVIEREVNEHLDAFVTQRFPSVLAAAVKVQVELVRRRLRRFAQVQADEARAGWCVHAVELKCAVGARGGAFEAPLFPDARGLPLVGRIDRVDRKADGSAWRALDYKTGSDAKKPDATHRHGRGAKKGEWKDLQLPLYAVLLRSVYPQIGGAPIELGYMNLAPNDERSALAMLTCTPDAMDSALETAADIVAKIQRGEFEPKPGAPVRVDDPLAPIWGLGMRHATDEDGAIVARVGGDE